MPKVIHLLMDGTPDSVDIDEVVTAMCEVGGVGEIHHVHIWRLDEDRNAIEAHVVLLEQGNMDSVKADIKKLLAESFSICHSTLEFEYTPCSESCGDNHGNHNMVKV